MTASQGSRPLAPLPIRLRPQRAETAESYARRLARANHLRPSYLRAFLCDPPRRTGVIRPWRLAAISGRSVRALEHALADLTQGSPPRRQPRAPGSVRTLISTWLLTEPELTPAQIWQRLLDGHDTGISYSTIGHYRRSIINSHYRLNAAFRAGSDDSNKPQSAITATFTRTSHASPIARRNRPGQVRTTIAGRLIWHGTAGSRYMPPSRGCCNHDPHRQNGVRVKQPVAADQSRLRRLRAVAGWARSRSRWQIARSISGNKSDRPKDSPPGRPRVPVATNTIRHMRSLASCQRGQRCCARLRSVCLPSGSGPVRRGAPLGTTGLWLAR